MEYWLEIPSFPGYSVSDFGRVRNDVTDRLLALRVNQRGIVYAGLSRGRLQHKRSVSVLVTSAFLPKPKLEAFDTPINLDGDRLNNHIDNLTLRPKWFAVKYFQQFYGDPRGFKRPIEEINTKEYFKTSWEAAIKYGLLDHDILMSVVNCSHVWPTYQTFQVVEK